MADVGKERKRKSGKRKGGVDGRHRANLIWAIAHPLRRCILRAIGDRGAPCSPIQLARQSGLPVSLVAYHVNVLCNFGAVELTDEQQQGGTIEHFYDSTIEDDPPIETLLEETRELDEEAE
ncbi:MAG TPA: helix-turn-helix domain-containing protein [Solirubrobacterales bacterium]